MLDARLSGARGGPGLGPAIPVEELEEISKARERLKVTHVVFWQCTCALYMYRSCAVHAYIQVPFASAGGVSADRDMTLTYREGL